MHIITGCWRGFGRCRCCRLIRWCCCHDPCPLHSGRPDQVGFQIETFNYKIVHFIVLRTLSEVKRVLKPGGKFYYMEHIIAQEVIEAFLDNCLLKLHWSRAPLFVTCNKDLCSEVNVIFLLCSSLIPRSLLFAFFVWFQDGFKKLRRHYKCAIWISTSSLILSISQICRADFWDHCI